MNNFNSDFQLAGRGECDALVLSHCILREPGVAREELTPFSTDPERKKPSGMPEYADSEIVSNSISVFLRPTTYCTFDCGLKALIY